MSIKEKKILNKVIIVKNKNMLEALISNRNLKTENFKQDFYQ